MELRQDTNTNALTFTNKEERGGILCAQGKVVTNLSDLFL